jgi:hypothetical protein
MNTPQVGRRRGRSRPLAVAVAVVAAGAAGTVAILGATTALAASSGPIVGFGGKCVDVAEANTANGTPVQLYTCNGTNAQQWTASNGELVNTASGGGVSSSATVSYLVNYP